MITKRTNPDFLNGVPELLILSLLARRPMHGYELVQAIRQSTQGTLEFGEGCVYLHISQLIQLAVPLAIGWWFWRRVRSRGRPQLAS